MLRQLSSIQRTLLFAAESLACCSDSPRLEAELLLCHILRHERSYLYSHPEVLLNNSQLNQYHRLLARRRAGEPLAYLTGLKEFWSLPLVVTKEVLIPRPETELIVELALDCSFAPQRINIADLGTGCGAIACAIAHERTKWRVIATDFSEPALRIANRNAERLELQNIDLLAGHWLHPLARQQFQIIASNPPYVRENDPHLEQPELAQEPRHALVSRHEGLADLQEIVSDAPYCLSENGVLILEHGHDQGARVRQLLRHRGFKEIRSHVDLAGLERVTLGKWNV